MCQNIYISSKLELPEIHWNENSPGFYLKKAELPGLIDSLEQITGLNYFYYALSHMGCACGLCYGDWSRDSENDNHPQRLKDVKDFADYLDQHKLNNEICLFSTDWNEFPDTYPRKEFRTSEINKDEFSVEEMVVLTVV